MKITYYGHSSLKIETNHKTLIVDPFISGNPKASTIDLNAIKADYILITHAHQDHVLDVETIAKNNDAIIVANHEIVTYYEQKGYRGHGMNHGGSKDFTFGRVKAVNAIHSSSFADGANGGNPFGYVIEANNKTIYIAGDTALTMDMKLIPLFFKLNLAILPIGGNYTMDVGEASVAADFVECNTVLGVHYDTFPPIDVNKEKAVAHFTERNKKLVLLEIGESITV